MSTIEQLTTTRPATFWAEGNCRDLPADWFHPDRGESTGEARAVCAACPVRPDCLQWAITNGERFGVWGGTSERERRRIRRRLAAGDPVPELEPDWTPTDSRGRPPLLVLPPTPEEPEVDLATATPEPTTNNGTGPPLDPATGRPTDVCVNCGKRYTPKRRDQRFHTKECARAWYATHPRGENGKRTPRIRKPRRAAEAPVPVTTTATAGPGVDVQALLGQLLTACDRWAIEADLGDIRVSVTRGCR
jgi:WhiB family redox-sensing transcriptional regulator